MSDVPQYVRQMISSTSPMVQFSQAGAQQTAKLSAQLGDFATSMSQNSDKVQRLRAQATMRENMHRMARESGANPALLQESLTKYRDEFIGQLPNSMKDEFAEIYRIEAIPYVDASANMYNRDLRVGLETESLRNFSVITNNLSEATKLLESSTIPEQRQAAAEMMRIGIAQIDEIANMRDGDGMQIFSPQQQVTMLSEAIASPIKALSPQAQMMALNPPVGFEANLRLAHDVESVADLTHINEDGVNKKGEMTYAYRGINSDANPVEFEQLKSLVEKGKTKEAASLVDKIYKEKYWDANNIDALPANVQGIIFDAAINQGSGYAQQLIKAVERGAQPSELLQMREDRYNKTTGTPSERRSWANRLKRFTPIAMAENADLIPLDAREQIEKGARQSLERDAQLRRSDYGAWARLHGKSADAAVAEAGGSRFVPVLPKAEAQDIATNLSQLEDPSSFTSAGLALKQKHANYFENVIGDLEAAKAPSELTAALRLIGKDHVTYQRQIKTMFAASKVSAEAVNMGLKGLGKDPLAISADVAEAYKKDDFTDIELFELQENTRAAYKLNKQEMLTKFVKVYMINNPSASVDEAIAAGMAPYNDGYKIGKLNSYKFKIPTTDNAEALEKRLNEFYRFEVRKAVAEPTRQFELANNMVPVLAPDNETYYFVDATGEPISVDNAPLKVTITELKNMQTLDEKRGVLAGLPYAEREEARREIFGLDVQKVERAKERKILADKMKRPVGAK
jgi:hypothetical protein